MILGATPLHTLRARLPPRKYTFNLSFKKIQIIQRTSSPFIPLVKQVGLQIYLRLYFQYDTEKSLSRSELKINQWKTEIN